MRYRIVSVMTWGFLVCLPVCGVAEQGPNSSSAVIQELEVPSEVETQEAIVEPVQPPRDEKPAKEHLRGMIRAKRERLKAEMKVRREALRAEGAAIRQEMLEKKVKMHARQKDAAELMEQPVR